MKVMVVIHRAGVHNEGWGYDVLVKLSALEKRKLKKIEKMAGELNRSLKVVEIKFPSDDSEVCEYKSPCGITKPYESKGWIYVCGGDTLHHESYLAEMGIKSEGDLEGLINYLKRTINPDKIIVIDHKRGNP